MSVPKFDCDCFALEILRSNRADAIATFDPNHFEELRGDITIIDPSKPKASAENK